MDFDTNSTDLKRLDASLLAIESSIRDLLKTRQKVRVARNKLVPIHRLPPEVLVKIFALIGRSFGEHASRRLLRLTWVSHHWRSLTLGSPNLWAVITNSNLPHADEWVSRSKECPISVGLVKVPKDLAKSSIPRFFTILSQLHRMEHLRLTLFQCHMQLSEDWFRESSAPLLTSLELERVHLPDGFLGKTPNARVIYLRRCQHLWPPIGTAQFPYLTSLHILYPRIPVSVDTFVESLDGMPQLETLVLVQALVLPTGQVLGVHPQLNSGPQLSLLKLASITEIDLYIWFLRAIQPRCLTSRTIISCNFDLSPNPNDASHLPQLLSSFDQLLLRSQAITSLSFDSNVAASGGSKPTVVINYQDMDMELGVQPKPRSSLTVQLHSSSRRALFSALQHNVTLSHLQAMRWCDPNSRLLDAREYLDLFGGLPKLEYADICVRQHAAASLLRSSTPSIPETTATSTDPPPIQFSALKVLKLCFDKQTMLRVTEFLRARKFAGLPLETLVFSHIQDTDTPDHVLTDPLRDSVSRIWSERSPETKLIEERMLGGVESVFAGCDLDPFPDD